MKKAVLLLGLSFSITSFAQTSFDDSINSMWNNTQTISSPLGGAETLGNSSQGVAPVIPPARVRSVIPGTAEQILPVEETDGPLNLAPNDAQAYILYNRATIAYRSEQFENARQLYRDLIRRYPESSYTPYALYTLSISEKDYLRKIRILTTIAERFPYFPYLSLVLDRLGDIYYLLDSPDAAEEAFLKSKSPYSIYMLAMLAMDKQQPNKTISLIRKFLPLAPDKESAYQAYMLYAEALITLRRYNNAITVLQKSIDLRPWAYDNGALILLNTGRAYFYANKKREALYAFSLLRLRFSRSTEARIADQFLTALSRENIINMQSIPWLASGFETIIKEQPIVRFRTPTPPSRQEILELNGLPPTAVPTPNLNDVAFLPPMPIPTPPQSVQSILVPIVDPAVPTVELLTFTNTVLQEVTNEIPSYITNRVFVIETNTLTNSLLINQTNTKVLTNIIQEFQTNTVVTYEPVVIFRTNVRDIERTNVITNVVDFIVTNRRVIDQTNFSTNIVNFIVSNQQNINTTNFITNLINFIITNKKIVNYTNIVTNVVDFVTTNQVLRTNNLNQTNLVSVYITNQRPVIRTNFITNIQDVMISNQRFFDVTNFVTNLVQFAITNERMVFATNTVTNVVELVVTNRANGRVTTNFVTNVTDLYVTNTSMVFATNTVTNVVELVVTNRANGRVTTNVVTNVRDLFVTNERTIFTTNNTTNITEVFVTNRRNGRVTTNFVTNITDLFVTNQRLYNVTNYLTNLRELYITNRRNGRITTNFVTNRTEVVISNQRYFNITNFVTNTTERYFTNRANGRVTTNYVTNLTELVVSNQRYFNITNYVTNLSSLVITNRRNGRVITNFVTNYAEVILTNRIVDREIQFQTNLSEFIITNQRLYMATNFQTNVFDLLVTNIQTLQETNIITNTVDFNITNRLRIVDLTNIITNVVDFVATNERLEILPILQTNYNVVNRRADITNIIKQVITNRYLEIDEDNNTNWRFQYITNDFVEIIPSWRTTYPTLSSNLITNIVRVISTNQRLEVVPRWVGNIRTNDAYRITNEIITNTRLQIGPSTLTNFQIVQTNLRERVITNVQKVLQTNFTEQVITNLINLTNTIYRTNVGTVAPEAPEAVPEIAPLTPTEDQLTLILDGAQDDLIEDPIFVEIEPEPQALFASEEVARLEQQVGRFAEQAAGIAGQYAFPETKGYVVRIVQVKDVSVANIIMQDLVQANLDYPVGIYYRESYYYLEVRSIPSYERAQEIAQKIYALGYTDVQLFEQFEVVEYQE